MGSRSELIRLVKEIYPEAAVTFSTDAAEMGRVAREAVQRGSRLVVAGGGDGTVNSVASAVAGTQSVLGILPLGTLNHFARDLRIPMDLKAAIANLGTGQPVTVDVGEVNGHIFMNNSGLGLYPAIVRLREKRQRRGQSKWVAAAFAAVQALRHYRRLALHVKAGGKELVRRTSIAFLGNNEYAIEGVEIGTRSRLDAGVLCLYVTGETHGLKLFALTLGALMGRLQKSPNYNKILAQEVWIRSKRRSIDVTLDGEVIRLLLPLHFRIRPGALRVLVPVVWD